MIGRVQEVKELNRLYSRDKAELVAIYGRRRVGKTYLVDETFTGRITFRHAGLSPADENSKGLLKLQLNHFYNSLELQGMEKCDKPTNWLDAFLLLEKFHIITVFSRHMWYNYIRLRKKDYRICLLKQTTASRLLLTMPCGDLPTVKNACLRNRGQSLLPRGYSLSLMKVNLPAFTAIRRPARIPR